MLGEFLKMRRQQSIYARVEAVFLERGYSEKVPTHYHDFAAGVFFNALSNEPKNPRFARNQAAALPYLNVPEKIQRRVLLFFCAFAIREEILQGFEEPEDVFPGIVETQAYPQGFASQTVGKRQGAV